MINIADVVDAATRTSEGALAMASSVLNAQRALGAPDDDAGYFRIHAFATVLSTPRAEDGLLGAERARLDAVASAAATRWRSDDRICAVHTWRARTRYAAAMRVSGARRQSGGLARGFRAWRACARVARTRSEIHWAVHAMRVHLNAYPTLAEARRTYADRRAALLCRAALRRWVRHCTVGVGLALLRAARGRQASAADGTAATAGSAFVLRLGSDGRILSLALRAALKVWRRRGPVARFLWRRLGRRAAVGAAAARAAAAAEARSSETAAAAWARVAALPPVHSPERAAGREPRREAAAAPGARGGSNDRLPPYHELEPAALPCVQLQFRGYDGSGEHRPLNHRELAKVARRVRCRALARWRRAARTAAARLDLQMLATVCTRARAVRDAARRWACASEEACARAALAAQCRCALALGAATRAWLASLVAESAAELARTVWRARGLACAWLTLVARLDKLERAARCARRASRAYAERWLRRWLANAAGARALARALHAGALERGVRAFARAARTVARRASAARAATYLVARARARRALCALVRAAAQPSALARAACAAALRRWRQRARVRCACRARRYERELHAIRYVATRTLRTLERRLRCAADAAAAVRRGARRYALRAWARWAKSWRSNDGRRGRWAAIASEPMGRAEVAATIASIRRFHSRTTGVVGGAA